MVTRAEAKQQTREALILAGMELFRQQGLDAPSLDAICEAAGKTRGAFYVHFEDREAFQVAVMERIISAYVAIIVQTADPAGDLERTVENFANAVIAQNSERHPKALRSMAGPGEPVDHVVSKDEEGEVDFVMNRIQEFQRNLLLEKLIDVGTSSISRTG